MTWLCFHSIWDMATGAVLARYGDGMTHIIDFKLRDDTMVTVATVSLVMTSLRKH